MKLYFTKFRRVVAAGCALAGTQGLRAGLDFCRRQAWRASKTIIFEKRVGDERVSLPPNLRIIKLDAAESAKDLNDVLAAGAGEDIRYFEEGAWCYLAYLDERPVAIGWRFRRSRLLDRLGYDEHAVYLGGFNVVASARGRGIYPLMLRFICQDLSRPGAVAVLNTDVDNQASQHALARAGFAEKGVCRVLAVAGIILSTKWVGPSGAIARP